MVSVITWLLGVYSVVITMYCVLLWRRTFDAEATVEMKDYAIECQLKERAELMDKIERLS